MLRNLILADALIFGAIYIQPQRRQLSQRSRSPARHGGLPVVTGTAMSRSTRALRLTPSPPPIPRSPCGFMARWESMSSRQAMSLMPAGL